VDAALPAGFPLEVLHGVRDVGVVAVDAAVAQRAVEDMPGGTDERVALLVLLVPGLLADQSQG
jgi:hypothetical protein